MEYCLRNLLLLSFSLIISSNAATTPTTVDITNHGGSLLTGNLSLTFIWYGRFGRTTKIVMTEFVKSLTKDDNFSLQPHVTEWWDIVEGFQETNSPIVVHVSKEFDDANYSAGKSLTTNLVKDILIRYHKGNQNSVPVIFIDKDVKVQGLCTENCSIHGVLEHKPYLIVGDPEKECLRQCGWPFNKANNGPIQINPPNGNVGTDAMLVAFAQGLVNLVTNPFHNAFFLFNNTHTIEPGTACPRIFGTGAFPGYPGRIHIDPNNGGGFNSHGVDGYKFLLPSIWDLKTKSCWTLM